ACVELGEEGRLIRMQLEELVADVPDEKAALLYDYHADGGAERTREGLEALAALPYDQLLEFELLAVLGYPASVNPLDHSVSPRGYRVLSHIPRLPDAVVKRVVSRLGRLEGIVRASQGELEPVGLRKVIDEEMVSKVLKALTGNGTNMPKNWNRRFKHNRDKMKTGDIFELAEVVRNLALRDHEKGLSTGEKQMFVKAKKILA